MRLTVEGAATRLEGPLLFPRRTLDVGLQDAVEVRGADGRPRLGRIAAIDEQFMTIEVLESTSGLSLESAVVRFLGEPLTFGLGPGILGRVFNGVGQVIDGGPPVATHRRMPIDGLPMNPVARALPRDFIETGITTLDLMNSLVRGQKLPLFSGGGLPHDRLAVEIASHARLRPPQPTAGSAVLAAKGSEPLPGAARPTTPGGDDFVIVFAGIGVPYDSAEYFRRSLEQRGALERTALFLNLASDSSTQRLLTPRFALSAAEYPAFERAGCLRGAQGTLTQLSILTMPADDIGHPIPDLTGYITEGQIVLSRDLDRRGIYPPVNVLPSLSRLMKDGIGAKYTDPDHPALASQLYAAYARAAQVRVLASVVGVEGLAEADRRYLAFGTAFEQTLVNQDE